MARPRVLLSTTSFQDTPGAHHALLDSAGFELVRARGPLDEARLLETAGHFDACLCGDDAFTRAVLKNSLPRLRVISKYGIGLDKIDLEAARELGIPVLFTPGVNHTTVAEHTFALLLATVRHLVAEAGHVAAGRWTRITGDELCGKRLALVGFGRIAREVALRARAFGLHVHIFTHHWDDDFALQHGLERADTLDQALGLADFVSLHTRLGPDTRGLIDARRLALLKPGAVLVNTARGELVDLPALVTALRTGRLRYAADVLDQEPPPADHPLLGLPGVLLTPHIGSRTHESVLRQATCAVENLTRFLSGRAPLARAV
jgi:phosphoglycerate dehydrogenase-like enzyme